MGRDREAGDRSRWVGAHTLTTPGLTHAFLHLGVTAAQPACPEGMCAWAGLRAWSETPSQDPSTHPERRPGFCGTSRVECRWILKCRQVPRLKESVFSGNLETQLWVVMRNGSLGRCYKSLTLPPSHSDIPLTPVNQQQNSH